MKRILTILAAVSMIVLTSACEKFLNRDPKDKQTNDTYWQNETSLRTYAQGFYSTYFVGYGTDYGTFGGYSTGDDFTDDFIIMDGGGYYYFPKSNTTDYNSSTSTWTNNYSVIYKANVMIDKIPAMNINDETKNHWMGVARFFRAMAYSNIVKAYGGCPLIKKVVDPADVDNLYQDRSSFLEVANFILEDYQYAINNMRASDKKLQVNKYVAAAYMSRDLLFMGTWLKYHGSNIGPTSKAVADADINKLLQGAVNGAEVLMNSGVYKIGNTFNALFSSEDLYNNPEIVFYREYFYGVQCNSIMAYECQENERGGLTENAIESFLCTDGLPICQSPLYKGGKYHKVNQGALQNRDPRLYDTIADSLRVYPATGLRYNEGASCTGYAGKKFLNEEWWATKSIYTQGTQPSPADGPCIRYAEVLLNYVEARYELSKVGGKAFTQDDLDKSINAIRKRQLTKYGDKAPQAAMPSIKLNGNNISVNGVTINDTARDADVDPVLWEIRRERRTELMYEGRRGEDLKRWAKYENLNSEDAAGNPDMTYLGAYVDLSEAPYTKITGGIILFDPEDPTNTKATKGYLLWNYKKGMREFKKGDLSSERYYLKAIPVNQITLYKDKGYTLTQNPGWE